MNKISRRQALAGGALAAGATLVRWPEWAALLQASAAQPKTTVRFKVPAGACDAHVHVFGDPQKYPMIPNRVYTPELASVAELKKFLAALGMERVVVIHPSVYGTDNRVTLDALRELGKMARGIAVIDPAISDAELDNMAQIGVRGVRINLVQSGVTDPSVAIKAFQTAADRAKPRGWHVQINTNPHVLEAMGSTLAGSPVPLVFDHFGGAKAADGVGQPGFSTLVSLVKSGKAYVKVSAAADLVSTKAPDYSDVAPLAKALVAANPDRILWGSDWPHPDSRVLPTRKNTDLAPLLQTDDGLVLNLLETWVPDAATRHKILVDNPAKLYGF